MSTMQDRKTEVVNKISMLSLALAKSKDAGTEGHMVVYSTAGTDEMRAWLLRTMVYINSGTAARFESMREAMMDFATAAVTRGDKCGCGEKECKRVSDSVAAHLREEHDRFSQYMEREASLVDRLSCGDYATGICFQYIDKVLHAHEKLGGTQPFDAICESIVSRFFV